MHNDIHSNQSVSLPERLVRLSAAITVFLVSNGSFGAVAAQHQLVPTNPPGAIEARASNSQLRVGVDPRVELSSVIFRLAGNPEYSQARVESYTTDVEKQFGPYREHPAIQLARQLRVTRGVSYDACMGMAVHVNDAWTLQPIAPFTPWPEGLDSRWTPETVSNFLAKARQFANDTDFSEFLTAHQPLYETTSARLQAFVETEVHLEWLQDYFGERSRAGFTVVAGLLNGGACYGARSRDAEGNEQLFCILGVWKTDRDGMPEFTADMAGTVVHEFCHSYANSIVDRHQEELEAAGRRLYQTVANKMRSQAYGTPETMLRESLVRACTVRYYQQYQGADAARRAAENEKRRGFPWTGGLSDLLADYEAQREVYSTMESFSPRLVTFFNECARMLDAENPALKTGPPTVVSMTPANGARDVDPDLTEIKVTFDRPMQDGSWSLVGGGPRFPELIGPPRYDSERTTWTVQVNLKPQWRYEFHLNRGSYDSFRSEDGVPLEPVSVTFTTATNPVGSPRQ